MFHNFDSSEIRQIKARHQDESYISFEGDEESTFKEFHEYIMKDPDILIYSTDNHTFLDDIMRTLGYEIGRDPNKASVKGRVCLESKSFHIDLDLAGLIERARFGFLPMGQAARYGYNRLIDSLELSDTYSKWICYSYQRVSRARTNPDFRRNTCQG